MKKEQNLNFDLLDKNDVKIYKNYLRERVMSSPSSLTDSELVELIFMHILSDEEFLHNSERIREFGEHNQNNFSARNLSFLLEMICSSFANEKEGARLKKSDIKNKVAFLKVTDELFKLIDSEKLVGKGLGTLSDYNEAGEFFIKYIGGDKTENFCIAFLNEHNVVLDIKKTSVNDSTAVHISAEEIAEQAFNLGAEKIIIAHNHTSDSLMYSKRDWETTFMLSFDLEGFKIKLLEHFIVTSDGYKGILKGGIGESVNDFLQ